MKILHFHWFKHWAFTCMGNEIEKCRCGKFRYRILSLGSVPIDIDEQQANELVGPEEMPRSFRNPDGTTYWID